MPLDVNASTWNAASVLADVRQKARIPAGSLDYTDANLLEEATRQIWSFAGWAMSQAADGRLLTVLDRPSSASFDTTYAEGREVDLPFDAVGDGFDSIFWVDAQGNEKRLELVDQYAEPIYDSPASQGSPWGYSLIDGRVRLYPKPSEAGTVRINYHRRLPRLVSDDDARFVSVYAATSSQIQVTYVGTQTIFEDDRFDVINPYYPYRFVVKNAVATSVASLVVTSTTYNSTTNNVDLTSMRLVPSGVSPYVHLPLEFKACLTQKIAAQILGDIGDAQGAAVLEQKAEAELGRVVSMLNPRAKTARQRVVNPHSLMRSRIGVR
jgi:hypothetical protein